MLKSKINFKRLKDKMTKNNLPLIGNEVVASIINRTQKGKDANNRNFKGYTKEYKATKKKKYGASNVKSYSYSEDAKRYFMEESSQWY